MEITCEVVEGGDAECEQAIADTENVMRLSLDGEQLDRAIRRLSAAYEKRHPDASGSGAHNKGRVDRDNGKFVSQTDPKDSASAEPKVASFAQTIKKAPGVSESTAQRRVLVAKNLTDKQAHVLHKARATKGAIEQIAALTDKKKIAVAVKAMVAGAEIQEALRRGNAVGEPKLEPKVTKEGKPAPPVKTDADLTDDEWLVEHCSRVLRAIKNPTCFKADAILYRRISKAVFPFRATIKKAVVEAKRPSGNGGWFSTIYRILKARHPVVSGWHAGVCEGTGKDPEAAKERPRSTSARRARAVATR